MELDFKTPLTDLKGTFLREDSETSKDGDIVKEGVGEKVCCSRFLASGFSMDPHVNTGFHPIDALEISRDLRNKGMVDLKTGQIDLLKTFITKSNYWAALWKGQILLCLKEQEGIITTKKQEEAANKK